MNRHQTRRGISADPNRDHASAATRIFDLPELLEMILLSLPYPEDKGPDLQFYQLQRVNRTFRDAICRPGTLKNRMFYGASDPSTYAMVCYGFGNLITANRFFIGGSQAARKYHNYNYTSQITFNRTSLLDWRIPLDLVLINPWDTRLTFASADAEPPSERFTSPDASWRQLPLLPTKIEMAFCVHLNKSDTLYYRIYSGGKLGPSTMGEVGSLIALFRTMSNQMQLIIFEKVASMRQKWTEVRDHTLQDGSPGHSVSKDAISKCDICTWMSCCEQGCLFAAQSQGGTSSQRENCYRCVNTYCRGSADISVCWPMDRELLVELGVINNCGPL